jgi:hypothetical protein
MARKRKPRSPSPDERQRELLEQLRVIRELCSPSHFRAELQKLEKRAEFEELAQPIRRFASCGRNYPGPTETSW